MSLWLCQQKGYKSRLTSAWLRFEGDRAFFGAIAGPAIASCPALRARKPADLVSWGTMRVERILIAAAPALAILLVAPIGLSALEAKAESKPVVAQDARVAGDRERTRFIADLSKKVDVHVFAMGNPYRVIVDAPDVSFQMPDGIGKEKRGLVTAYRYGLFAPGKARIVIDVSGPFSSTRLSYLSRATTSRHGSSSTSCRPTRRPSSRS